MIFPLGLPQQVGEPSRQLHVSKLVGMSSALILRPLKYENQQETWISALFWCFLIMNNKGCRVRSALVSIPLIVRVKWVCKCQGENTPPIHQLRRMEPVHMDILPVCKTCSRLAAGILLVLNECLISIKWMMMMMGQTVSMAGGTASEKPRGKKELTRFRSVRVYSSPCPLGFCKRIKP